jgi:organic radical activating enzyme
MLDDYAGVSAEETAYVIFTGGEPTLHARHLNQAIAELEKGSTNWYWACESNGTLLALPEVALFYQRMHRIVISPKPPSSQNVSFDWVRFWDQVHSADIAAKMVIKPVVMDETDMVWFRAAAELPERPLGLQFIMQTYVDPDPDCDALADFRGYWRRTLTPEFIAWMRRFNVRLLPRLHNLIWGNEQGF